MSTQTKVLLIIASLSIFILGTGYNLGGRLGLFFGLIIALCFILFFFLRGENISTEFYKAKKLSGQDPWQILPLIQTIAETEKLRVPDVYLFHHPGLHCFSYWPLISPPRICFSNTALEQLNYEDIRSLIIHQTLFLKKTDSPRYLFVQRFAQSIVALARAVDQLTPIKFFYPHRMLFFEKIFSYFAELAIDFVYNERLYSHIDLMTGQRTQSRETLGDLLWRMNGVNHTQPLRLLACSHHLFFLNPRVSNAQFRKRLQKLVGYYPV